MSSRGLRASLLASGVVLLGLLFLPSAFSASWLSGTPVSAQVRPVYSRGAVGLVQVLERLQTTASMMHTGAHPDDEDSALIARVARGDRARVAYLSLNRGEGGQNIIGPELFDALGVIRTEELLQARALDGGEQFFTTAFDFGFTKTMEEAGTKYGEERILGDMVRAIRLFRPLVLISRMSGTPADGHGQHQLAGKLSPLAFKAAGDPARFPEQLKEGLRPWQPKKFYVGQGFRPAPGEVPTVRVATGLFDPLLGRTYFEIAMEGRSQHKTQEMGQIERRGPFISGEKLVDSLLPKPAGTEQAIFDGLDTSVPGLARLSGLPDAALQAQLTAMQQSAAMALKDLDVVAPAKIIPTLVTGLRATRDARAAVKALRAPDQAKGDADFLLALKEQEFQDALVRASGLVVDALVDRETAAPGESVRATVNTYLPDASSLPASAPAAASSTSTSASASAASSTPAAAAVKIASVSLHVPDGWTSTANPPPAADGAATGFAAFFRETPTQTETFAIAISSTAAFTEPYWLERERKGNVYDWASVQPAFKNRPFAPPVVTAELHAEIGGIDVTLVRPLEYRYADPIRGEIRREFNVVPALTVAFDSRLEVVALTELGKTRRVAVRLQNQTLAKADGVVRLRLPQGWTSEPAEAPFALTARGERAAVVFQLTPAAGTPEGHYQLSAEATVGDKKYATAMQMLEYPHIQTHRLYEPAMANARVFDVKVANVQVGYIMGSGDQVPDAIHRLGLPVTMITPEYLATGDLATFDTIVVGVRASEARPDFVANTGRLLTFVRDGGTLIVQYQQPDYVARKLTPFPAEMQTRVTDENAPIKILQPEHPAFTFPNRIVASDWDGWVQERNLYAFSTFDPQYVPLLETNDPGEPVQRGGEVYAHLGKGHYVYTSYAWFRQLPAGVPGAYRLFANLLSLPKAPATPAAPAAAAK
jgi:LmbE family N-acetylglucosaminyl deacetylase